MKFVSIYTDGACQGNPGYGGWAVVLCYNETKRELSGAEKHTTNNRMELLAAIKALEALALPCKVALHTDSAYLANAYNEGWLSRWKLNNWMTSRNQPIKNKDMWVQLDSLVEKNEVSMIKVKGHSDNELNNRCDILATQAIKRLKSRSSG